MAAYQGIPVYFVFRAPDGTESPTLFPRCYPLLPAVTRCYPLMPTMGALRWMAPVEP